jgi:hypothetical protein
MHNHVYLFRYFRYDRKMGIGLIIKKHFLLGFFVLTSLVVLILNISNSTIVQGLFNEGRVLAQSNVNVNANVSACILTVEVLPEKRIPQVNNWQTNLNIQIFNNSGGFIAEHNVRSNSLGRAEINLCEEGTYLSPGRYAFWVKGYSHLRKDYGEVNSFATVQSSINLTLLRSPNGLLFAGETSNKFDNFINVLDISTIITTFYTNSEKNDLNQDSIVNVLDISNSITNYLLQGDCSPKDRNDGAC